MYCMECARTLPLYEHSSLCQLPNTFGFSLVRLDHSSSSRASCSKPALSHQVQSFAAHSWPITTLIPSIIELRSEKRVGCFNISRWRQSIVGVTRQEVARIAKPTSHEPTGLAFAWSE